MAEGGISSQFYSNPPTWRTAGPDLGLRGYIWGTIEENCAYIIINKEVERVSKNAVDVLNSKDIILTFPSMRKNNKTVRVLKTPKIESSIRKVFIPRSVAQCLAELKKEQDEIIEALGSEYQNYNLVLQFIHIFIYKIYKYMFIIYL